MCSTNFFAASDLPFFCQQNYVTILLLLIKKFNGFYSTVSVCGFFDQLPSIAGNKSYYEHGKAMNLQFGHTHDDFCPSFAQHT